jgi:hypothetical protein
MRGAKKHGGLLKMIWPMEIGMVEKHEECGHNLGDAFVAEDPRGFLQ